MTKHVFYVCGQENTNFFAYKYSSVKHVSQNNSTDCRGLARMSYLWEPDELDQVSCFLDHQGDEGMNNDCGVPTSIMEHSVIESRISSND